MRKPLFYKAEDGSPIHLGHDEMRAHWVFGGATRVGKTVAATARTIQRVRGDPDLRTVTIDWMKADASTLLLTIAKAIHRRMPSLAPDRFVIIKPFDAVGGSIIPVRILNAQGDGRLQALGFADLLGGVLGGSNILSPPMRHALQVPTRGVQAWNFAHRRRGPFATLLDMAEMIRDRSYAVQFARRLEDPKLRSVLLSSVPADATRTALLNRLDLLLSCREIEVLLCSQEAYPIDELLRYHLIINLTGGPAGSAPVAAGAGAILFHEICGALHRRRHKHQLDIFLDEFPELMRHLSADAVERVLSQGQSAGASIVLAAQDLGVLRADDVRKSILRNTDCKAFFAPRKEDLRLIEGQLARSLSGNIISTETPDRTVSRREEYSQLVATATSLPRRHLALSRELRGIAVIARTADVPMKELQRRANAVSQEVHEAYRFGRLGKAPCEYPTPRLALELEEPPSLTTSAERSASRAPSTSTSSASTTTSTPASSAPSSRASQGRRRKLVLP